MGDALLNGMIGATSAEPPEVDYKYDDLKQENSVLRTELTALYNQFLTTKYDAATMSTADQYCQTEVDFVGQLESTREQLKLRTSELSHEKSHNAEQAKLAKEADRKIRELEVKILAMNTELLQAAPLKNKLEEMTRTCEQLQSKLSLASNEYLNVTVEMKYLQEKIASLNHQLDEYKQNMSVQGIALEKCDAELKGIILKSLIRVY